ncbi:hypothetical protein [Cryobacterium sp. SO1]|uniref:hypothetical protein n=1 Tax=Cryobacterium sp. SO1 TaxID=1897061 RepID=UPI001023C605|nr:hypothetical protein [Cryobacterium sp. SO1]RZI35351.1 hypothetical protein BJQ95_02256 [Cryobacterium sp. SO1]
MAESVLASSNQGPAKKAILDFVDGAITPGDDFVKVVDCIAAFDNDDALWLEQPLPPKFDIVFRKWGEQVKAHPALAQVQPYKGLLAHELLKHWALTSHTDGTLR